MGGKSKPKAPDYTPMAEASKEAARYAAEQAFREHAFAERQYYEMKPLFEQITNAQIASQDQQNAQARDYYNYLSDTFRPVERGLVEEAQNFNSDAYQERLAQQASADAARAFSQQNAMSSRAMMAMGVNPNSGAGVSLQRANDIALAAQRAQAMTDTRFQADQLGYARRLGAAELGRGLAGSSTAAYAGALAAGNSAGSNAQAPGDAYMRGLAQSGSTRQTGFNQQMTGLNSILSTQASVYGADKQAQGDLYAGIGSAVGMLGGGWLGRMG